MEGYKLFKDAVEDASKNTSQWKYVGDDNIFVKPEMLAMAAIFDGQFTAGGWNYFLTFPDGEIDILATEDNSMERLFLPIKTRPKFCMNCGNKLDATSKFCMKCGTKI